MREKNSVCLSPASLSLRLCLCYVPMAICVTTLSHTVNGMSKERRVLCAPVSLPKTCHHATRVATLSTVRILIVALVTVFTLHRIHQ
jgi:hypothetical protein